MRRLGTLVGVLAASGCAECGVTCIVDSPSDLEALSSAATECDVLSIEDTDLTSLSGAEGIRSAFTAHVARNATLTDVSALGDFSFGVLNLVANASLEEVVPGPLSGGIISVDRNAARVIKLQIQGDVELAIREDAIETVRLDGSPTALRLTFVGRVPPTAQWDAAALNMTSLRVFEVSGLQLAQLEALGVPTELVGVYASGLQADSPDVTEYNDFLRVRGFAGVLEVCPHRCDANGTPRCDDPNRPSSEWRTGCAVLES